MTTILLTTMGVLLASPYLVFVIKRKMRPFRQGFWSKGNKSPQPINLVLNIQMTSDSRSELLAHESDILRPQKDWKSVPPRKLVLDILYWCMFNIPYAKNRKVRPQISVNFSKNDEAYGRYYFKTKTIEIFYSKHELLEEIVDTVIHEYVHHLQLMYVKSENELALVNRKTADQPFEVEAREIAKKYRKMCIRDLGLR